MKTLFLLFILDFSGSMYQTLNGETKVKTLKDNMHALHLSMPQEQLALQTGVLTFGIDPKLKCNDIHYTEHIAKDVPDYVNKLKPGAFSRTPLAESIKRATDITIERKVKQLVIFSDGADTCGRDPCEELIKANEKLKAANYIMDMKFIGFNLENDERFACFRDGNFSNIRINNSNVTDSFQVQEVLKDVAEQAMNDIKKPFGSVSVQGAPSDIQFQAIPVQGANAKSKLENGKWNGSFKYKIKEGQYFLQANHPKARKLKVQIVAEDEKKLYWSDFFARPYVILKYQKPPVSILLTPSLQTKEGHRKPVGDAYIEGQKNGTQFYQLKIPFGEWKVQVVSPEWVNASGDGAQAKIEPMLDKQHDFSQSLNLKWVSVPDPAQRWVFEVLPMEMSVDNSKENRKRFFIESKDKLIPLNQADKVNWVQSSP